MQHVMGNYVNLSKFVARAEVHKFLSQNNNLERVAYVVLFATSCVNEITRE